MFLVNEPEAAISCDLSSCVGSPSFSIKSAIDNFEDQLRNIIKRGFDNRSDPFVLGMLMMVLTSACEMYFRTVISNAAISCPICNANNIDKGRISFRAVEYYPAPMLVLALVEHVSFSDSDAVRKQTQELLQITVPTSDKGSSSIATALQQYDRVCALRHALIHSSGLINSQNSAEAGLQDMKIIFPSNDGLQMVADICRNVVLSFNQFLFNSIISRLYQKGQLTGDLGADQKHLKILLPLFLSTSSPSYSEDMVKLHSLIHSAYGPAE